MTEAVRKLSRPEVRTPFILITTNFFLVTLSGASAIIYYSVDVFQSKGVAGLNKHLASIIVAVILVLGGILGIFLVKKYPRVQLSLIMMTIKSFCMAVLGAALYERSLSEYQQNMIKVTTVTVYMLCSSAGLSIRQYILSLLHLHSRNFYPPVCLPWIIVTRRLQSSSRSHRSSLFRRNLHRDQNISRAAGALTASNILVLCCCLSPLKHLLFQLHAGDQREDCVRDQTNVFKECQYT